MSKIRKSFLLLFILSIPFMAFSQNLLSNPESIVFDPTTNSYLVSNVGDGSIVKIDSMGTHSYFSFAFFNQFWVAGLHVTGDTLIAAVGNPQPTATHGAGIALINMSTTEVMTFIEMPEVGFPNDIAIDRDGIVYVTDYWDNKIYRFINWEPSIYFTGVAAPNGILYDELNHRLLVLAETAHDIVSIDIADSTLSTIADTQIGGLDGIFMDHDRNVYFSSWTSNAIHQFDSEFANPPTIFSSGHPGPADIYFDRINDLLCIPCFNANRVDFIEMNSSSLDEENNSPLPTTAVVLTSYPNPFNPETTISFELQKAGNISLTIYDINGKEITNLVNGYRPAGQNSVQFNGEKLPSGIYFAKISGDGFEQTKRLHLLK